MVHGMPRPRKTFTELLPVTLTMDASAYLSCAAAAMDAKRSGMEVPRATKVRAVTESGIPVTQPKSSAKSITMHVMAPMATKEATKQTHPPAKAGGGTEIAKRSFHGKEMMWKSMSAVDGFSPSSLSPTSKIASMMSSYQLAVPRRIWSMFTTWSTKRLARTAELCLAKASFSFRIVMVSTHLSSPPSSFGLKMAPPSASSRMIWNWSDTSPICLGLSSTSTSPMVSPCAKVSSPSLSTKS
mmetsp:Transcript_63707/g.166793  ORF Transcript_63707/g.166793 Transcript_63707/m.166793 type:complete len:241 (+) Transcript_63707:794-1516(+)